MGDREPPKEPITFARLTAIAIAVGLLGGVAVWFSPSWFPAAATEQADRHDLLYAVAMVISGLILGIVTTFLVYSIWKFRRREDDFSDGPPIHGHTTLEVVWTLIPTAIVVGLAVYGGIVLDRNEAFAQDRLVVRVTGQQFVWNFEYPREGITSPVLVIPLDRDTEFEVTAQEGDVIHSFYVPEFRIKQDANPGIVRHTVATPTETGTFTVVCTELCGLGHAQMRAVVQVVTQDEFARWVEARRQDQQQQGGTS